MTQQPTLAANYFPQVKPETRTQILDSHPEGRIEMAIYPKPDRTYLYCTCYQFGLKDWCKHVEVYYKKNFDAQPNCDVKRRIGYLPIITVFIDPPLMVQTGLVPVNPDGLSHGLHSVHCLWGKLSGNPGDIEASGGESMGFIDPTYEGRGTIRKLFLEWIPSQYYNDLACKSQWHDGYATLAEQAEVLSTLPEASIEKARRRLICDTYSIMNSKICYNCSSMSPF